MNNEITKQCSWLIDKVDNIELSIYHTNKLIDEKQKELESTDIYKEIEELEQKLKELDKQNKDLGECWKELLFKLWLKKIETLDGRSIQLDKLPWKLIIEDNTEIPDEYINKKVIKSIDKKAIKSDLREWLIIEWVNIKEDYKLVIKHSLKN